MTSCTPAPLPDVLAMLLRGEPVLWKDVGVTGDEFLDACEDEDLIGLAYERIRAQSAAAGWPADLRAVLAGRARAAAAVELARMTEIRSVLDQLTKHDVHPVLLKGTALAYVVYESAHLRPRCDTDLFVPRRQLDLTRRALESLGYSAPPYCGGELVFGQLPFVKTSSSGVRHVLDVHWKISTQAVVADLLTYEELATQSVPVPRLGPEARTATPAHALLLACVHAVVHHRNVERLLWINDIHLLVSRLSLTELEAFVELARAKRVATVSAHGLALARARLGTTIPDAISARLAVSPQPEPSAAYLRAGRRWHHEQVSNLRHLASWTGRLRLAREVLLPDPGYMRQKYGLASSRATALLLPALYLHRGVRGGLHVLAGRK